MNGIFDSINGNMEENKFSDHFDYYISLVDSSPLLPLFSKQAIDFSVFLDQIPAEKLDHAYEAGKWTVKEVVFHIIETEIIMLYRAIRISRGDKTPLPGYDENMLIAQARVNEMNWDQLKALFSNSRQNSFFYFNHMTSEELKIIGMFSNLQINVEKIGYLIAGHLDHHLQILKERYLK
jgi:hypothetical protein